MITAKQQIGRKLARRRAQKAYEEAPFRFQPLGENKPKTGADLVAQLEADGVIGAWADRQDIGDSSEYARELRRQAETREKQSNTRGIVERIADAITGERLEKRERP